MTLELCALRITADGRRPANGLLCYFTILCVHSFIQNRLLSCMTESVTFYLYRQVLDCRCNRSFSQYLVDGLVKHCNCTLIIAPIITIGGDGLKPSHSCLIIIV